MPELVISDVRPRVQYTADGVQTVFPYPFPIIDQVDLVVVFNDDESPGSNVVTGVGASNGGDVVFDVPPPVNTRITIYRDMAFARETDFQEAGDFRAAVINEELDRMAMLLQQAEMLVGDSLHKPLFDVDATLTLPSAADRSGKVLAFDEAGLPTVGSPSAEAATLAAASASGAAISAAAAANSLEGARAEANFALNAAVPIQTLSGDGVTVAFVLDRAVIASSALAITIDGIKQHTTTYTAAENLLTFSEAPPSGTDNIEVTFIGFVGLVSELNAIPDNALSGTMISGGTMDGVSLDSLNDGALGGFRNRIMNGGFDIWQRGTVFNNFNIVAADRWGIGSAAAPSGLAVTRESFAPGQTAVPGEPRYFIRIAQNDNNTILRQEIEDVRTFAGKQITYSFWIKANAPVNASLHLVQRFGAAGSADVAILATALAVTSEWQKMEATVNVPSISGKTIGDGSAFSVRISLTGSVTIEIANVQLEEGPVATPFEVKPPGFELALCQRYYVATAKSGSAWAVSPSDIVTSVLLPVTMRVPPTVSLLDTSPTFNDYNIELTGNASVLTLNAVTPDGAQLRMTGFTGAITNRPGFWNQTTPIWSFDAELGS